MQLQARLSRPSPNAASLHNELPRVQPESAQTKHTSADRADVLRPKFRVSVCKGRLRVGIKNPQRAPVQDGDAACTKRDPRQPVEQGVGDCRSAGGAANDRNPGSTSQSTEAGGNRCEA